MKWYPADWRADPKLRMCSLAARGLWVEIIGYCHEAEPYGHLVIAGCAPSLQELANLVGVRESAVRAALDELEAKQVCSRDSDGRIYSRRMLRDKAKAEADKLNGKRGGNPKLRTEEKVEVNPPVKAHMPEARSQIENLTPLSSSPETPPAALDVVPLGVDPAKPSRLTSEAVEVLAFLNGKTRRHFRPSETTLKPIRARLKEGFTVAECRAVIARKFRAWSGDPKMAEFLRPSTLFGAEKFAQYVGEVPPPEELSNAS